MTQFTVRNGLGFSTLPGKPIMLVQKTVSEYLLERGMVLNGQQAQLSKLRLINTSDSDIVAAFLNNKSNQAVVTWKPLVSQIVGDKGVHSIFDSSKIPGEILDLLVVRTELLNTPNGQKFAKAITGAWYETVQQVAVRTGCRYQILGRCIRRFNRLLQRTAQNDCPLCYP